jgi:hypothetical protein
MTRHTSMIGPGLGPRQRIHMTAQAATLYLWNQAELTVTYHTSDLARRRIFASRRNYTYDIVDVELGLKLDLLDLLSEESR